jgi:hypothetical protein
MSQLVTIFVNSIRFIFLEVITIRIDRLIILLFARCQPITSPTPTLRYEIPHLALIANPHLRLRPMGGAVRVIRRGALRPSLARDQVVQNILRLVNTIVVATLRVEIRVNWRGFALLCGQVSHLNRLLSLLLYFLFFLHLELFVD